MISFLRKLGLRGAAEKEQDTFLKDLFELTTEQELELKESVKKCAGTIQVWMHPYYREGGDDQMVYPDDKLLKLFAYKADRKRMIEALEEGTMPVIVFIDSQPHTDKKKSMITQYANHIRRAAPDLSRTVYFVRTYEGDATPCIAPNSPEIQNKKAYQKNWELVAHKFKDLGICAVILRGMRLDSDTPNPDALRENIPEVAAFMDRHPELVSDGKLNVPVACVGAAWIELENAGFKVVVSRIAYPEKYRKNDALRTK